MTEKARESVLKRAVIRNAKKEAEKHRGSGSWLNEGVHFDHDLMLSEANKEKAKEIFQLCKMSQREENYLNFEILIANLIYHKRKPVVVSLSPNEWKRTQYVRAGASTITLIKQLHEQGYINMKKGYKMESEARETRIWATEKLLDHFPEFHNAVIYDPVEIVELRDGNGKLKEYKNTANTWRIRQILERANKVNQSADIRHEEYKLSGSLVAIYTRKFTLYGRLHTKGYRHYQGFSEEERGEMTINGDPVIELDFSGLHPHLLYAKEEKQFFGDPYGIVNDRPEARPFLKQILLCMLNAPDEIAAERAANYWLYHHHKEREALKEIGITRARPLITAFREAHKPIDHYFCNGSETGLRVMNLDARIALDIVDHFAKQRIPILAIHDSFIVQYRYKDELKQTMSQTYKKHTGGFRCPIK